MYGVRTNWQPAVWLPQEQKQAEEKNGGYMRRLYLISGTENELAVANKLRTKH